MSLRLGHFARCNQDSGGNLVLCWLLCLFGARGRFRGAFWASGMFRACRRTCHKAGAFRVFRVASDALLFLAGAFFGPLAF